MPLLYSRRAASARHLIGVGRALLAGLGLLLAGPVAAQTAAWSQAALGSTLQAYGTSRVNATATDAAGNVYVTGTFTGRVAFGSHVVQSAGLQDLFVAKYLPASDTWAWAQGGGGRRIDQGNGIAVSGTNVYVTGSISNTAFDDDSVRFGGTLPQYGTGAGPVDLVLVKYTDNGNSVTPVWSQVGGGLGVDVGNEVAVSGSSVYVTGYLENDVFDGRQVRFGGSGTTLGTVAQAGAANVMVGAYDLVLAKYTDNGSSGTFGWAQVGGGTDNDQGSGVAVSGNSVYVTGFITNNDTDSKAVRFGGSGLTLGTIAQRGASNAPASSADMVLVKYLDNGSSATVDWTQVAGGTYHDTGAAVAVSGSSVYVAGAIVNSQNDAAAVRLGGSGSTAGTVVQAGAAIYAGPDGVLIKYVDQGSSARVGWSQVGGGTNFDAFSGVAVSGSRVYVVGQLTNDLANSTNVLFGGTGTTPGTVARPGALRVGSIDIVVARYTDTGPAAALDWVEAGGSNDSDVSAGVAVSGSSVYVTGTNARATEYAFGTVSVTAMQGTMSDRGWVGRLADGGTRADWQTLVPSFTGGSASIAKTVIDAAGNVYVAGSFSGQVPFGATVLRSSGDTDLFVAKYLPASDTWAWAISGGGTGIDYCYGLAVSGTSVYLTGYINNNLADYQTVRFGGTHVQPGASTTSSADLVLVKLIDQGNAASVAWTQVAGGRGGDQGRGLAVSGNSIYVVGIISNSTTDVNAVRFGGSGSVAGTVVQHGATAQNSTDVVLAKYTDQGSSATVNWTQVGGGTSTDSFFGVAVSGSSVYATGSVTNTSSNQTGVVFGGSGTTAGTVAQAGANFLSSTDMVLVKYLDQGSSASVAWTQLGGGEASDTGYAVAVSGSSVYVAGVLYNNSTDAGAVRFGGSGLTAGTVAVPGASGTLSNDAFLAKYTDNGSSAALGWTVVDGGSYWEQYSDLAVEGNRLYLAGHIGNDLANSKNVRIGGVALPGVSNSITMLDAVAVKYLDNGSSATLGWALVGGTDTADQAGGIAVGNGRVCLGANLAWAGSITPHWASTVVFGAVRFPLPLMFNTPCLAFVQESGLPTAVTPARGRSFGVYPTLVGPERQLHYVGAPAGCGALEISSVLGQRVARYALPAGGPGRGEGRIPVVGLAAGWYLVRLAGTAGPAQRIYVQP